MVLKDEMAVVDVSRRLRQLRQERGLSMRSLARLSGLSTNALSMIERGKSSPSVSTLYKMADALGVPITAFFRTELARESIVFTRSTERPAVQVPRGFWQGLGGEAFSGRVEPFILTLESGATSGPHNLKHSGHEFVYCLQGEFEYEVEGRRFSFEPGDSLLFASQMSHRWRNSGKGDALLLVVLSGFEVDERPSEYHLQVGHRQAGGQ